MRDLQVEALVELRRPVIALRFRRLFPLFASEMRADQIHLDVWSEHACRQYPLQIVRGNN